MIVDVTNPVVIKASSAILQESVEQLRRVCFVSFGETKLLDKEFKEVYRSNYREFLNGHTELTKNLNGFFSRANNKSCVILELGEQTNTPLDDTYNNKMNYLNTQSWFSPSQFYEFIYDDKFIKNPDDETTDILIAYWNSVNHFNEDQYRQYLTSNRLDDNVISLKLYLNSLDIYWDKGYYEYLALSNQTFQDYLTSENLDNFLDERKKEQYNDDDYHIYLEENGVYEVDYTSKIDLLNNFIFQKLYPCYVFVLPNRIAKDANIRKNLFNNYNDINARIYFYVNLDTTESLDFPGSYYNKIKGCKCVAGFYDNSVDSVSLASQVAGLFASNIFDISELNPASPFNYKTLNGLNFNEIEYSTQQKVIQSSLNFIGSISKNVVLLNGRFQDTYAIDYWYQWDLVAFYLERDLKALILNGVNNPVNIVKYDQTGIDILESRVKATLNNMINYGCLTEFGASIDSASGELKGRSSITTIPFNSYIKANPDDYKNEIYNGISFYLRIGKYIRQVVLNATLG
ncbi:TPA: hypothetical protein RTG57_001726 [Campylobacter jejuni]|nr:hypothetical protein [Campylobacter jejuni]